MAKGRGVDPRWLGFRDPLVAGPPSMVVKRFMNRIRGISHLRRVNAAAPTAMTAVPISNGSWMIALAFLLPRSSK